jgi:hypothetical protein
MYWFPRLFLSAYELGYNDGGGNGMRLLRTKTWIWWDISLLKWCCFLFGMLAGAYFRDYVMQYFGEFLVAAIILMIRPIFVYFRD